MSEKASGPGALREIEERTEVVQALVQARELREIEERTEVVQALVQARELLRCDGWGQDAIYTDDGPCALGALYSAIVDDVPVSAYDMVSDDDRRIAKRGRMALDDALSEPYSSIVDFNDAPETTKADVLRVFTRAIRLV